MKFKIAALLLSIMSLNAYSENYEHLSSENMAEILNEAKARGNDYVQSGFTLSRVREGSMYDKLGLRNGDTLTEINGIKLKNAREAIRLLQSLKANRELEIAVLRDGKIEEFTIQLEE